MDFENFSFHNHRAWSLFCSAILFLVLLFLPATSHALNGGLQVPDEAFEFNNGAPAYAAGKGPRIVVHGRDSFFVRDGGLLAFSKLVASDGFNFKVHEFELDKSVLKSADILVIANVYSSAFSKRSVLNPPSVYSDAKIREIEAWVKQGGSLMILADHSPLGGGTKKLGEAFGFTQMSGYLIKDREKRQRGDLYIKFTRDAGTIGSHPVTDGSLGRKKTDAFMTFGGQALIPPAEAVSLFNVPSGYASLLTYQLNKEFKTATRINSAGLSMGAVMEYGKGRIAYFGEAASFTSQIFNKTELMGFIHPDGQKNPEFVLSTMRWLSRFKQ